MENKTRDYVFIGLYSALTVVLAYFSKMIPFLQMPQGGSIELYLIPTFICSYHLGWKSGVGAGLLGFLASRIVGISGDWYLTPIQYLLDYIVPACVCGFASLLPNVGKSKNICLGVVTTMILKYLSNVLAGVYFWFPETSYAGSIASWTYSLGYNLYYNLATLVIAVILVPILCARLSKTVKFKVSK